MKLLSPKSRVKKGATLLDSRVPRWWKRIDVDLLEMNHCNRCVMGQLFGDYWNADAANTQLGFSSYSDILVYTHGFNIPTEEMMLLTDEKEEEEWASLREEWIQAIKKRRQQDEK